MDEHFREVGQGERYDVVFVDSNGVLLPGTGPRTLMWGND
jgi:hypothetical protein